METTLLNRRVHESITRFYGSKDLRVEDIATPKICGPRQVMAVKVAWCGICGTDLHEYAKGPIFGAESANPGT